MVPVVHSGDHAANLRTDSVFFSRLPDAGGSAQAVRSTPSGPVRPQQVAAQSYPTGHLELWYLIWRYCDYLTASEGADEAERYLSDLFIAFRHKPGRRPNFLRPRSWKRRSSATRENRMPKQAFCWESTGLEPAASGVTGRRQSLQIFADQGKSGSAVPHPGHPMPIVDACFGTACTILQRLLTEPSQAHRRLTGLTLTHGYSTMRRLVS